MTAQNPTVDREVYRLITNGQALLKSGKSSAWIRQQWVESGITESDADTLLVILTEDLPKAQRKRMIKLGVGLVAVPLLLAAGIFGIVKVVQASKGPNPYTVAIEAATIACGDRPTNLSALDTSDGVVLTAGSNFRHDRAVTRGDDTFGDLVLTDDELAADQVICVDVDSSGTLSCEGYFSNEIVDVVENSTTLEEAIESLRAMPNGSALVSELMRGGTTLSLSGSTVSAELVQISNGSTVRSTAVDVEPTCPSSHYGYSSSERTWPQDEHYEAVADDLGISF